MSFPAADRADLCEPASSWQRASTSQASAPLSAGGTRRRAPRAAAQSGAPPPAKDRKTPSRRGLRPPSTAAVPSGPTEAAAPPAAPPGGGASSCSSSPSAKLARCASYSARRASASSVAALSSSLRFSSLASSSLSLASLSRCLLTCAFHAFETNGGLRNRTIHYSLAHSEPPSALRGPRSSSLPARAVSFFPSTLRDAPHLSRGTHRLEGPLEQVLALLLEVDLDAALHERPYQVRADLVVLRRDGKEAASGAGEKRGDGKTNASEAMPRSEDDLFPNTPYTFQNLTLTSSSFL